MKVTVTLRFELDSQELPISDRPRFEEDRIKDHVNALIRGYEEFPTMVYFTIERTDVE